MFYPLKSHSGVSIQEVDDSAISESGFPNAVSHYGIVLVGVYSKVPYLFPAPIETGRRHSVGILQTSEPVDSGIGRFIIQPLTSFDYLVRRVFAGDKGKGALFRGQINIRKLARKLLSGLYLNLSSNISPGFRLRVTLRERILTVPT